MKKRTIGDLLKKLDEARITNDESITNLNEAMSKKMLKGGYEVNNNMCTSVNNVCNNNFCRGTTDGTCTNEVC
jgi:hypothetical protein